MRTYFNYPMRKLVSCRAEIIVDELDRRIPRT